MPHAAIVSTVIRTMPAATIWSASLRAWDAGYTAGMDSKSSNRRGHSPIASLVQDDGSMVEMIHSLELRRTALVKWQSGAVEERDDFEHGLLGRLVPYSPRNNLLMHGVVLFPSGVRDFQNTEQLRRQVQAFIHRYASLSPEFEEIASYYVLMTWVFDAFPEVPYLRLKGDFGTGKSRCLQTIGSLCYKPMFVSGASTVSPIFRIIDAFQGTLILDESDFRFSDERAEIIKILNNGNAVGFPVLRSDQAPNKEFNPRAFSVFGPKVIATRRDFDDRALESRCITEVMTGLRVRPGIPLSLPTAFHEEARAMRNQLLMYRFRSRFTVRVDSSFSADGLEPRVAQMVRPLLAVAEDEGCRDRMVQWARIQSGSIREERGASVEADLLAVLHEMRKESVPLVVRDITARFAERFGADLDRPASPRWIGTQLRRRLSLAPIKSHGSYLIPPSQFGRLDALLDRYGVGSPGDMGTSETS